MTMTSFLWRMENKVEVVTASTGSVVPQLIDVVANRFRVGEEIKRTTNDRLQQTIGAQARASFNRTLFKKK